MSHTLQFKITLKNTDPKIWRRFVVEDTLSFHDLHLVIQIVMGWTNSHLHQFIYERSNLIGDPELLDNNKVANERKLFLSEFFDNPKMQMIYEYDFGDSWNHELVLEKIQGEGLLFPICIEGKMRCPPEDCGSISGFYNMLDILKNKKHPEYKETREWLGGSFNSDKFDIDDVNEALKDYKGLDESFY